MQEKRGGHPDEPTLEAYLLGSLPLRETKRIEGHLLTCPGCVEDAKEVEEYIRSMRKALDNTKMTLAIAGKGRPG